MQPAPRSLQRPNEAWRALLSGFPELARWATEFSPLTAAAAQSALERGRRTRADAAGWVFAEGPFEWKPRPDRPLWIVAGTAGGRVVIAVLEAGEQPKYLASTILIEAKPALAIGYNASEPGRVLFTTCCGCAGHGGSIALAPDGRPAFAYR